MEPEVWARLTTISDKLSSIYEMAGAILGKRRVSLSIYIPKKRIYVRPCFLNEIYMGLGLWEPYVTRIFKPQKGDVVLDVGAHIGYYTIESARAVGPEGMVVAVEPDPRNLMILQKNVRVNNLRNVRLINCALGSSSGSAVLELTANPLFSDLIRSGHASTIEVEVRTMDDLCEQLEVERLDWTKIDVEGSAAEVLKGGRKVLGRDSKIIIELNREALRLLREMGYSFKQLGPYVGESGSELGYYYAWR